jgi:hypothetical protein
MPLEAVCPCGIQVDRADNLLAADDWQRQAARDAFRGRSPRVQLPALLVQHTGHLGVDAVFTLGGLDTRAP